ncbi:MAG: sigma-70 family RNA polymerase sigma factor [Bacteroidota bacterium]
MISEKQLIKDCQHYKKAAQFELVKRYSPMLMTVSRRYAHDQATAKDILQESFIRIFSNIQNFRPTGSFEAWMRKITVHCALQWLKKRANLNESIVYEINDWHPIEPAVFSRLETEEIIGLIQSLPAGYRAVFNLNIIEGYTHKEISIMLNISESASRSQLTRARKILQKKLNSQKLTKETST